MKEDSPKNLKEILNEAFSLRNVNLEKLAHLTNIPPHYLVALYEGNFSRLPAAPYVRGYLMEIAGVLSIDGQLLWQVYKNENTIKISGPQDILPSNRFAIRPFNKKWLVIGIILFLAIMYFIWRANEFLGIPQIEIAVPSINNAVVNTSSVKLSGKISPRDKLSINSQEIFTDSNGYFEQEFSLQPGLNTVEFKIKRFLGKETKVVRQIIYQP